MHDDGNRIVLLGRKDGIRSGQRARRRSGNRNSANAGDSQLWQLASRRNDNGLEPARGCSVFSPVKKILKCIKANATESSVISTKTVTEVIRCNSTRCGNVAIASNSFTYQTNSSSTTATAASGTTAAAAAAAAFP